MTDSSVPSSDQERSAPAATGRQAAREAGTAAQGLAERILLLDRPRYVAGASTDLDSDHGGPAHLGAASATDWGRVRLKDLIVRTVDEGRLRRWVASGSR